MSDITFDTFQYVKRLKDAGVPEQQAEVQASALKELIEEKLATKADLQRSEERLTNKIHELSYKLTIRFGGMLVAAVLVLAAIIKF